LKEDNAKKGLVKGVAKKKLQLIKDCQAQTVDKPHPQVFRTNLYDDHWAAKQERGLLSISSCQ